MGAVMRQDQTQGAQSTLHHGLQGESQRAERGLHRKEDLAPITPGAYFPQVAEDCVTNRTTQGIDPWPLRFTTGDAQYLLRPIEVVQGQSRDFTGTKAV